MLHFCLYHTNLTIIPPFVMYKMNKICTFAAELSRGARLMAG